MPKARYDRVKQQDSDSDGDDGSTMLSLRNIGLCMMVSSAIGMIATIVWYASMRPKKVDCTDVKPTSPVYVDCMVQRKLHFRGVVSDLPAEVEQIRPQFEGFLQKYQRDYYDNLDATEYKKRALLFHQTLQTIDDRNAAELAANPGSSRATHGITKYADWHPSEFKALLGARLKNTSSSSILSGRRAAVGSASSDSPPCSKQWYFPLSEGSIRNQGQCGDCWTYSVTETLRTAYYQQSNIDPGALSTQFLVDCMTRTKCQGGVNGCCGGNTEEAMDWISRQGGVPTAQDYGDAYEQGAGKAAGRRLMGPISHSGAGYSYSGNNPTTSYPCKTGIQKTVALSSHASVLKSDEAMAQHVCSTGWISISVDATTWQTYTGGVISAAACGDQVNHAVVAIGLDQSKNAWIVQNSWGLDWGITINGESAPSDEYSNCAQLAGSTQKGCSDRLQGGGTVAQECQASCGPKNQPSGGYVYLQYGENTCDLTSEPVIVSGTSKAS